jgi:glycosyltransferase involved in cell wall biosynthesis
MICTIVPTYKARSTVCTVVGNAANHSDLVIVVDDACPQQSGALVEEQFSDNKAVIVIRHPFNKGVGGAMKSGIAKALELGATIIIKLDADDQMNTDYIPIFVEFFKKDPGLEYIKGNRFVDVSLMKAMPKVRLFGNSVLSLFVKFSSGYWNIIDPTNGYFAFRASKLRQFAWQDLSERYFLETHILCMLGLRKANIAEMEMPAVYGSETSSLSITRVLIDFPPKLVKLWLKRILFQYFLYDVNLGSLYLLLGTMLAAAGVLFGAYEWIESLITHVPRTTGTVMLAVLLFLMGFQLLLNALMYDVQFGAKSVKLLPQAPPVQENDVRVELSGLG